MKTLLLFLRVWAAIALGCSYGFSQNAGLIAKIERNAIKELTLAGGGQLPALTSDLSKSIIYVSFDQASGRPYAVTNFQKDFESGNKIYPILLINLGMLDPVELRQLFEGAKGRFTVTEMPVWIHNDVFQVFADTKFLEQYKHVSIIGKTGTKFPVQGSWVEIKPGILARPTIDLENLHSFLFERSFDPAAMEVASLLNNKKVNAALSGLFPSFKPIRTVDHVERVFETSKQNTICLTGHLYGDQLVRYRSDGSKSYDLMATDFINTANDLHKEVILIGCNYADDTSSTADVETEVNILSNAMKNRHWGDVLKGLAGDSNQVQILEMNNDGYYFKYASVSRPAGSKPSVAYSFMFFKTPSKPSGAVSVLRFLFAHSGKISLALAALQALFFFVWKKGPAATLKWVNLALLFIFFIMFLFSFQ